MPQQLPRCIAAAELHRAARGRSSWRGGHAAVHARTLADACSTRCAVNTRAAGANRPAPRGDSCCQSTSPMRACHFSLAAAAAMTRWRALAIVVAACAQLAAAAAADAVLLEAEQAAPTVLPGGPPLPAVDTVLELDGFVGPVPWARGADPAFTWVRARGVQLVTGDGDASTPVYHVGANLWHGMHLGAPSGPGSDRARLQHDLDALQKAGVTHVRVLGASEGPDNEPWRVTPALQPCPGAYNAAVLDGFDFLVYSLGKRRMRATVVLGNEWPWSGGHAQYVRWAQAGGGTAAACAPGRAPALSDANWRANGFQHLPYPGPGGASWGDWQSVAGLFYTTPAAQSLWRRHVHFMLTRVNRYTGVLLAEDPTVMLLELANEPRPKGGAPMWRADLAPFTAWLSDAAAFVKALAPQQLIASGQEGDTQRISLGQSAVLTQNISGVDVVTVHAWPMNFNWLDPTSRESAAYALAASRAYLSASIAEAAALGKPAVLEEFGWPRDMGSLSPSAPTLGRDAMYQLVMDMLLASAETQGALAGASFWGYAGRGRPDYGYSAAPATAAELCAGVGSSSPPWSPAFAAATAKAPLRNLAGGPIDWAACFSDEGARPDACPVWAWWVTPAAWSNSSYRGQSVLLHDPPHEAQGWYSVYDTDASTLAVVATAARRLAQLQGCTNAAVATARAATREEAIAAGGRYGAAACVSVLGAPPEMAEAPPRARACAAAVTMPATASMKPFRRADTIWAHLGTPAQAAALHPSAPSPAAELADAPTPASDSSWLLPHGSDIPEDASYVLRFAPPKPEAKRNRAPHSTTTIAG